MKNAETMSEPRQPMRLLKKRNIAAPYPSGGGVTRPPVHDPCREDAGQAAEQVALP